jgi:hypothetical protein
MITDIKELAVEGDIITLQLTVKISKSGYMAPKYRIHAKGRWGAHLPYMIDGKPLEANFQLGTRI